MPGFFLLYVHDVWDKCARIDDDAIGEHLNLGGRSPPSIRMWQRNGTPEHGKTCFSQRGRKTRRRCGKLEGDFRIRRKPLEHLHVAIVDVGLKLRRECLVCEQRNHISAFNQRNTHRVLGLCAPLES